MKTLEKGKDKIQAICKVLKEETITPAQREAEKIIKEAKERADQIVKQAKKEADDHMEHARKKIAQERSVFESSLRTSAKMVVETLRQDIETKLFNHELQKQVSAASGTPDVIVSLIKALVHQADVPGTKIDLSAVIPAKVKAEEINKLLGQGVLARLKNGGVQVGHFEGGAQVKMENSKLTLDVTDSALAEMLAQYVRKDFRKWLFAE